jgi:hypothetical protein
MGVVRGKRKKSPMINEDPYRERFQTRIVSLKVVTIQVKCDLFLFRLNSDENLGNNSFPCTPAICHT